MRVTAAILAGGRSARFGGRDKSALVVEGQPILEHQVRALLPVTSDILIVGGHAAHAHVRTVPDLVPGCGPLGGLHTALRDARSEEKPGAEGDWTTIVIACDMPYVSTGLVAHLAALASEAADDVDAVVPRTRRGYHPLCAAYSRRCLEPVERRLAGGRLKMMDLLNDVRLRVVTTEELERFGDPYRLLANVNTPADYSSLEGPQGHEL